MNMYEIYFKKPEIGFVCLYIWICFQIDDNEESDENNKENPSEEHLKKSLKKLKKRYLFRLNLKINGVNVLIKTIQVNTANSSWQ